MMKIMMGENYTITGLGLVRVVCRARNVETQKNMIVFVPILKNGMAGDTLVNDEQDFITRIIE